MLTREAVVEQASVASELLRAVASAPWLLAYPILAAAVAVGFPLAALAIPVFAAPDPLLIAVAWAAPFVAVPVAFSLLMVAYCHELDCAFDGGRPPPGSGLVVAASRRRRAAVAGLIVGTGGMSAHYLGELLPFAERIGVATTWGMRVAGVFAFPAIATTRGSLRETVGVVLSAVESEWGTALVTTASTQALGTAIAWAGLGSGVVFLFGGLFRVLPAVGPLGPFTLPLALGVGGILLAVAVQFAVGGMLRTVLYRYARDGEVPPALSSDVDAFVETDGSVER